jgi:hypothetical protein
LRHPLDPRAISNTKKHPSQAINITNPPTRTPNAVITDISLPRTALLFVVVAGVKVEPVPIATEELVVNCTPVLPAVLFTFVVALISDPPEPETLFVAMTPVLTDVLGSLVSIIVELISGPADPELLLVTITPVLTGVLESAAC